MEILDVGLEVRHVDVVPMNRDEAGCPRQSRLGCEDGHGAHAMVQSVAEFP